MGELSGKGERDDARIMKRPLGEDNALMFNTPFSSTLNIWHEHIFFDDEQGGNIGFRAKSGKGLTKTDGEFFSEPNRNRYEKTDGKIYDDKIMRDAVKDVREAFDKKYCLWTNNCQDFTQSVKARYKQLGGK